MVPSHAEIQGEKLANQLLDSIPLKAQGRSIIIIAGPPGSGKTTLATALAKCIKTRQSDFEAIALSMDGFHHSLKDLRNMENSEHAITMRGAPFTFDQPGILSFAKSLREWADHKDALRGLIGRQGGGEEAAGLMAPSFDHALKDPVADAIKIPTGVKNCVVIFEGNYLLMDQPGWRKISPLADHRIFLKIDPEIARDRLRKRHLAAGIVSSLEDGDWRAINVDGKNAELILSNKVPEIDIEINAE